MQEVGIAIWVEKSKVLAVECADVNATIGLNNQTLKEVESFTYVGSRLTSQDRPAQR